MERVRVVRETDIIYATPGGSPLRMDISRQEHVTDAPILLLVHGGGWCSGSRADMAAAAQRLARAGFIAANIEYRLAPAHPFPAAFDDLCAAADWLRTHAARFGGNAARLGAFGVSAGGHLVALLATRNVGPLTCAVSWGGPMDLLHAPVTAPYRGYALAFLAACPHEDPTRYAAASPIANISASTPPLLLIYGSQDDVVPPAQGEHMAAAAVARHAPVTLLPLAGAGHAPGDPREPVMAFAWEQLTEFLQAHLPTRGAYVGSGIGC
ncbi:MAG TPA: alpha/beta hydrolase [Armatimonadota bacterium]|jgi:acetyl esterase/lipase